MPAFLATDADVAADITCILSDVDGVMTDGRIVYDTTGAESKNFHVRDGLGIKLWMRSGYSFGIITARVSDVVARRAKELGITHVRQSATNKLGVAEEICKELGCHMNQVCYIGDDLPDIPVMRSVGLAVTPADGSVDSREAASWVLQCGGGHGAVRELVERLLRAKNGWEEHLR